jgi:acyl-CoA thioesterase I
VKAARAVQTIAERALFTIACAALVLALAVGVAPDVGAAPAPPIRIVALGDSLTAGYGLAVDTAFPAQLERALKAKGLAIEIANAGVSADTASAGRARLEWSVPEGTDAVIVELGANDALRGIDPKVTRAALDDIVGRLKSRDIAVLLAGMRAPRNMGEDYARAFDAIFPELAAKHGVLLYPFFLDGVVTDRALNQGDGLHPTAAGIAAIVAGILPKVEELIGQVRARGR